MIDLEKQEAFISDYIKLVEKHGLTFTDCGCCAGIAKILDLPADATPRPAFTVSTEKFKLFIDDQRNYVVKQHD